MYNIYKTHFECWSIVLYTQAEMLDFVTETQKNNTALLKAWPNLQLFRFFMTSFYINFTCCCC